jgi:hypothetical protein
MTLGAQKSTFPIALGVRITGVDDKAFSQTGESYSMITMPNADSHASRVLQEDNTDLAYEALFRLKPRAPPHDTNPYPCLSAQFARKFVSVAPWNSHAHAHAHAPHD